MLLFQNWLYAWPCLRLLSSASVALQAGLAPANSATPQATWELTGSSPCLSFSLSHSAGPWSSSLCAVPLLTCVHVYKCVCVCTCVCGCVWVCRTLPRFPTYLLTCFATFFFPPLPSQFFFLPDPEFLCQLTARFFCFLLLLETNKT